MADVSLDAELRAMQDIATILHHLDQPTRARVLHWIADRFQADAAATGNGAPVVHPATNGATLAAEADDDSLSVAMLGDLFESEWSDGTPPSNQTRTEQVRGMTAEDLSEFLDRTDGGGESTSRPHVKPGTGPIWPILPKPILA
ncbi:MAG TPA: hypothetical protein VFI56_26145 [Vicinamibacterales bacterium]|nr:hypothetical protein [Vicinamibacterales bacterium]